MENEIIRKYGKEIDMRSLSRDLDTIRRLINVIDVSCKESLTVCSNTTIYKCRICKSKNHKHYVTIKGYNYHLCENCNSVFLLNLPDVERLYSEERSTASNLYLNENTFLERVETIAIPKIKFVLGLIPSVDKKRIWCDIGCGVGEVLMGLKQNHAYFWKGIGIEADTSEIEFGLKRGLDIVESFIDPDNPNMKLLDIIAKADIVSIFNVLEHIEQPDSMIDFISINMKKGAYLVIEVPRHPSLAAFCNLMATDLAYRHIAPPQHLQVFSERAIEILTLPSFSLIAQWGFGQGYTDLLTYAMLSNDIKDILLYQQLMSISNSVQKVVDQCGFSDTMLFIHKKL